MTSTTPLPSQRLRTDKPRAAPNVWPMPGHRTVAQVDADEDKEAAIERWWAERENGRAA